MLGPNLNMDLITWVGAAAACTLVILLAVVILGHRIDKVSEQLIDLRLLQIKMQPADYDQSHVLTTIASLAEALPDLRSLTHEMGEVKRQFADLIARVEAIAQAEGELHARMQVTAQPKGELGALVSALEEMRASQSELHARMQATAQTNGELGVLVLEEIRASQSESLKVVGSMANVIQQWCHGLNTAATEVERNVQSVTPVMLPRASGGSKEVSGDVLERKVTSPGKL